MSDTRIGHNTCKTLVRHLSLKCQIQKMFVEFLKILAWFLHNFKKNKYINFLKTQAYCINFYYDYKNNEQIILNQPWKTSSAKKN